MSPTHAYILAVYLLISARPIFKGVLVVSVAQECLIRYSNEEVSRASEASVTSSSLCSDASGTTNSNATLNDNTVGSKPFVNLDLLGSKVPTSKL